MSEPRKIKSDKDSRTVYNSSGSTLLKGTIAKLDATNVDGVTVATAASDVLYGVVEDDILTLQWGSVQIRGRALVRGGAAVAIGASVTADGDGEGITAAANNTDSRIGLAMTVGADNVLFEVELIGPGGSVAD